MTPEPEALGRGVVFVNPGSGPHQTSVEELRRHFAGHDVSECAPDALAAQVRQARDAGVAFVGVAGGDGTIRCAAEQLVGSEVPLLAIPTGTRNHFARNVGITDVEDAHRAAGGSIIAVDVGQVNGRCFVNNSSIGLYPKVVVRREAHERRVPKGIANVVAAWEQLRQGRRLTVEISGRPFQAWMVFVGNGSYGEGLLDLADRDALDDNILDVRLVRGDQPLARLRIVGALLLGRLARTPLVVRHRSQQLTIGLRQRRVEVALDGEVELLATPLEYSSLAGALKVLVPTTPAGGKANGS